MTEAFAQKWLAHYHQNKGELAEAEAALTVSKELFLKVNEQRNLVEIDYSFARLAQARGQWPDMARYLVASLQRAQTQRCKRTLWMCWCSCPACNGSGASGRLPWPGPPVCSSRN